MRSWLGQGLALGLGLGLGLGLEVGLGLGLEVGLGDALLRVAARAALLSWQRLHLDANLARHAGAHLR